MKIDRKIDWNIHYLLIVGVYRICTADRFLLAQLLFEGFENCWIKLSRKEVFFPDWLIGYSFFTIHGNEFYHLICELVFIGVVWHYDLKVIST